MSEIKIKSIARWVATLEPIILKEEKMVRLIFAPLIVESWNGSNVKWYIYYQKKGINDAWEDYKEIEIKNIRKGEYVKLELDSASICKLLDNIELIQAVYNKHWIKFWEHNYHINEENVDDIIEQIAKFWDKDKVIEALNKLDIGDIGDISNMVNISWLRQILDAWNNNKSNSSEQFWQNFFKKHIWILSQIFSTPFIFLEDQPYLWWKEINNKWWVNGDFVYQNLLTWNIAFIEIKTPNFKLIKSSYWRNGSVYMCNDELTGAINQVLTQKDTFLKSFWDKKHSPDAYGSKCVLIVWNIGDIKKDEIKSFELFRNNLKEVEIITFDELFSKIHAFLDILQPSNTIISENDSQIEDTPF